MLGIPGPDPKKTHSDEEIRSYKRWQLLSLIREWGGTAEDLDRAHRSDTQDMAKIAIELQKKQKQPPVRWQLLEYLHQFSDYREEGEFWALRKGSTTALSTFVEGVKALNPEPSPPKGGLLGFFNYIEPAPSPHVPKQLSNRIKSKRSASLLDYCLALARLKGLEEEVPYLWCIQQKSDLLRMLARLYDAEDFTRRSDLYKVAKQAVYEVDALPAVGGGGQAPLRYMVVATLSRARLYEEILNRWPSSHACGVRIEWKGLPTPFLQSLLHALMFHGGVDAWYRKHRFAYEQARSQMLYPVFPASYELLDENMDRIERELLDSPVLAAKMKDSGLNAQQWVSSYLGHTSPASAIEQLNKKKEKHVQTSTQEATSAHRRSDRE